MIINRIKDLRIDNDLKQEEIAQKLNMKQQQYSRYERGENDIPTSLLIELANFYDTSTDYILGLTNETKPYPRINTFYYKKDKIYR